MKYPATPWTAVVTIFLGACSPAKVEMNRVQKILPPPIVVLDAGTQGQEEPSDPGMPIYLRSSFAVESQTGLQSWQSWKSPQAVAHLALSRSERLGWGNQVATEESVAESSAIKGETRTVLQADRGGLRCVFRNRLLDPKQARAWVELTLPAPMGAQDLLCVSRDQARAGGAQVLPQMEIAIDTTATRGGVRWVGTDARKQVPLQSPAKLEFKVSQIIAQRQGFGRALRELLPDGMDQLLNIERQPEQDSAPLQIQAARCGLSRSALVQITLQGERVTGARAFIHTRLLSARTQSQTRWIFTQPNAADPILDEDAQEDCRPVRKAWTDCLTDGRACSSAALTFARANFGDLLESQSPGFVSQHLFAATRADANGVGKQGAARMAIWRDLPQSAASGDAPNPLSVEDFQEFVDVIELSELSPGLLQNRSR